MSLNNMAANQASFASQHMEKQSHQQLRFPVVILGAGESGIAAGCLLKRKLGLSDFRIFDRQGGIGGAWWINRYPGVACDIPGLFYSYSFAPNYKWTSLFPPGKEIQQYLENVCEQQQIRGNIQLNTEISEAQWLENEGEWEIHLTTLAPFAGDLSDADRRESVSMRGESSIYLKKSTIRTKIFISCAGELVEPNSWPRDVPGLELFKGPVFHSARWKADVDLHNKDVVVVGTGCTSAQLVPSLMKGPRAPRSVTQLMRSPPWVMPRPKTPHVWKKYASLVFQLLPPLALFLRYILFLYAESTWLNIGMTRFNKWRRRRFESKLLVHLQKAVPEILLAMLTPSFGVGCRRIIIDDGWFDCLNLPNVELTTRPLVSVNERSVLLGPDPSISSPTSYNGGETTRPADVIILANGFETSTYLHRLKIRGTNGKYLHDVWNERGGPSAYLSTAIHGFPNFFMLLGPNAVSGHTSAILASENVANYALRFISLMLKGKVQTVEVKERAESDYTAEVQRRSIDKVWQTCRNGYIAPNGWNSSICPFNQIHFSLKCMFPQWKDWDIQYNETGESSDLWDILSLQVIASIVSEQFSEWSYVVSLSREIGGALSVPLMTHSLHSTDASAAGLNPQWANMPALRLGCRSGPS
ncbi:hypothetical protein AJ80_09141 [Polytolypa hystricis UAMH7299]|uniref:L-ornithine N(5)-oxygenase n=1 Tax=Polytolypa hystricis (strain UAMH7299) TaxID=1447883 RepID=A0A2B7WVY3_POLH7|nr:hypothetical protein AJ80_09141 [Polytolypa hystricis UAMH7299]